MPSLWFIAPLLLSPVCADVFNVQRPNRLHEYGHKLPIIDSEALQATIDSKNLVARAEQLFEIAKLSNDDYNHPTRVIGSKGHQGTLDYIYSELADLGSYYKLSNQSFQAFTGNVFESRLVIGHSVPSSALPFSLTPPTKDNEPVYGQLVLVANDGCNAEDYPANVTKNIAFIARGTCPFSTKSELAGMKGAIAAVVYNTQKGAFGGTLGTPLPDHVATFGISLEEATPFIAELKNGTHLDSIAYIDGEVKTINTYNVVAQTSDGDPDNCVMAGGHSDSVSEGPGINDDGSGTLSLLEVAKQLTKFKVNNCVRLAWWAGEEEGLLGSDYYADHLTAEENLKIRLFADYDMMASSNYAFQVYNATNALNPAGSEELRDLYIEWYHLNDLPNTFIPFDGRSDYFGFLRNGIPSGGIATGAEGIKTPEEEKLFGGKAGEWYDPCYHGLCDTPDKLNLTAWVVNTRLIAHSIATFALSFEGYPERAPLSDADLQSMQSMTPRLYRGKKLNM